jgi:hypothetical protein
MIRREDEKEISEGEKDQKTPDVLGSQRKTLNARCTSSLSETDRGRIHSFNLKSSTKYRWWIDWDVPLIGAVETGAAASQNVYGDRSLNG